MRNLYGATLEFGHGGVTVKFVQNFKGCMLSEAADDLFYLGKDKKKKFIVLMTYFSSLRLTYISILKKKKFPTFLFYLVLILSFFVLFFTN